MKKLNKFERKFLEDLLKTMEELKDSPDREHFCIGFDEEYKKLKERLEAHND